MKGSKIAIVFLISSLVFSLPILSNLKPYFITGSSLNSSIAKDTSKKFEGQALNIIEKCKDDSNCFKEAIIERIKKGEKVEDSIALFTKITESSNGMSSGCNSVGRAAGEELFYKYGKDVFNYYSVICGHAYVYGFMIGFGKKNPNEAKGILLKKYCLKDYNPVSCIYGAGYAISFTVRDGAEAQRSCLALGGGLSTMNPRLTPSYQMTGPGDCILGWTSGVTDFLAIDGEPELKTFLDICNGMTGGPLHVCLAEASFAYTFKNNPKADERIKRLEKVQQRCQKDISYECMQFLGKAVVDYLIYTLKINLKSDTMARDAAKTIERLCSGTSATACFMGTIQDQLTHTTHDDMMKLCSLFTLEEHRKFCFDTNLQHE